MGNQPFYWWLMKNVPQCIEAGEPSMSEPEFDNLYLDMNSIVHYCFRQSTSRTYNGVFVRLFGCIDHLIGLIRPTNILYMALDGVAPVAKMKLQRTRRCANATALVDKEITEMWDSNVISPGTQFMTLLSKSLQYYIQLRMNTNHQWRHLKVILSDANVPGEGEHKIMEFIRSQRKTESRTKHCLYGQDADLILLSLATHETQFSILREARDDKNLNPKASFDKAPFDKMKFEFVNVAVLRQYLERRMNILNPQMEGALNMEMLVDDFVFLCIFLSNDYLPQMPSLVKKDKEGPVSFLIDTYKRVFAAIGGYLTKAGEVNLDRVEKFIKEIDVDFFKNLSKKKSELQIKEDYYTKFDMGRDKIEEVRQDMVLKYVQGLCWICHYCYKGVRSWHWHYPYEFSPFGSDLTNIKMLVTQVPKGNPLQPFYQLLRTLPPQSSDAVPPLYSSLMTGIEMDTLLKEMDKLEACLSVEEKFRNSQMEELLYIIPSKDDQKAQIQRLYTERTKTSLEKENIKGKTFVPFTSDGLNGFICLTERNENTQELHSCVDSLQDIKDNLVLNVSYRNQKPKYAAPKTSKGVIVHEKAKEFLKNPKLAQKTEAKDYGRAKVFSIKTAIDVAKEENKGSSRINILLTDKENLNLQNYVDKKFDIKIQILFEDCWKDATVYVTQENFKLVVGEGEIGKVLIDETHSYAIQIDPPEMGRSESTLFKITSPKCHSFICDINDVSKRDVLRHAIHASQFFASCVSSQDRVYSRPQDGWHTLNTDGGADRPKNNNVDGGEKKRKKKKVRRAAKRKDNSEENLRTLVPSSIGGLVRDAKTEWVDGFSGEVEARDNTESEIKGLKKGLEIYHNTADKIDSKLDMEGRKRLKRCLKVQMDNESIVELLNGPPEKYSSNFLLCDCKFLLDRLDDYELSFIPRHANAAADHLARIGKNRILIRLVDAPDSILSILLKDKYGSLFQR